MSGRLAARFFSLCARVNKTAMCPLDNTAGTKWRKWPSLFVHRCAFRSGLVLSFPRDDRWRHLFWKFPAGWTESHVGTSHEFCGAQPLVLERSWVELMSFVRIAFLIYSGWEGHVEESGRLSWHVGLVKWDSPFALCGWSSQFGFVHLWVDPITLGHSYVSSYPFIAFKKTCDVASFLSCHLTIFFFLNHCITK